MKILYSIFLLIYLSFLTPLPVSAQATTLSQDLSGVWQGKLSQEVGGLYREYDFKLELKQMGNVIQGISRISADGYSANMSLEGTLNGNFVEFKEIKISGIIDITATTFDSSCHIYSIIYNLYS
jgi:hypothetical protein